MILVDTCVFIDYFRGHQKAADFLQSHQNVISLSAITDMEIAQGVRNKAELRTYFQLIDWLGIKIIEVDQIISTTARDWVRTYGLSHTLYLADSMIAATAYHHQLALATVNQKDFRFLDIELQSIS